MAVREIHSDLIEGCRKNNRKAQLRVYELYYKAMYNTSYRIVNDSKDAEDIMQESFLDAFDRINVYQGTGTFGSWLKRIVINKSLDYLKKSKPETISIEEKGIELQNYTEPDDSYVEHVFYRMEMISKALNRLPDNYRIILSLYLLEGYDHQEIAQILEISYNNVRTRYSRAKQSLIMMIEKSKKQYMDSVQN